MKIEIKNLGAVKKATIDLSKKLSLFCGGNSTGKTYMAYLIYAITSLDNKSFGVKIEEKYIDELIKNNEVELPLTLQLMYEYKKEEEKKIKPNLWKLFAIPENKSDVFFKKTEILFDENQEEFDDRIKSIKLNEKIKFFDYQLTVTKNKEESIKIKIADDTIKNEEFIRFFEIAFGAMIYSKLIYFPIMSSAIFPVERNSIFTFSKQLSIKNNERFDLIKQLSSSKKINKFELLFGSTNRYPQAIRDCLKVADDLEEVTRINSVYYEYATNIEKELLGGKVIISNEGEVQFLSNKTSKNKTLSFHQSSSIVKTLSGLILYLKHTAQKNDLVIIDEPEMNLHPDNQVILTRIIAQLINEGLNFVISTHSDYIIREFNNLIMLSNKETKQNIKDKYGLKENEYINKEDIAVKYFHFKTQKQADVENVEVTEYGFDIKSIDEVIEKQNDLNSDLYYSLKFDYNEQD